MIKCAYFWHFCLISRLYPYQSFLPAEGISSVEDTLQTFQLGNGSAEQAQMLAVESIQVSSEKPGQAKVRYLGLPVNLVYYLT